MAKYIFIAGINENNLPRGGAESKNQILLKLLQRRLVGELEYVDMALQNKHPTYNYVSLIFGLIKHRHIIISVGSSALDKLSYLNFYLKQKKITIFIIGGLVDKKLINPRMLKLFEQANIIYAETKALTNSIRLISDRINVKHLPNFKELLDYTKHKKSNQEKTIKMVFLSRVNRDKGIFRTIEVVKQLNSSHISKDFELDIYGPIDLSSTDVEGFKKQCELDFINYRGYLDLSNPESYTILSQYHFFMFLTSHSGEGFPGVLIDALHAGSIIIASDWKYNNEIIPKTNLLVDLNSNYYMSIHKYIERILEMKETEYRMLIQKQHNIVRRYDISKIKFEIA